MQVVDRTATTRPWDAVIAFPKMRVGVQAPGATVDTIYYLPPEAALLAPRNALAERAVRQLERYRDDPDAPFDLPIAPRGTEFQRKVWDALMRIPCGTAKTYGTLAREIGGVARAVGQACGENHLPIVIPCHRVVAANGLGGFAHSRGGYLLEAKKWLLGHERVI